MWMSLRRLVIFLCTALLLTIGLTRFSSFAQSGGNNTCSALVEQAIAALGSNCEGLGRNSACYGTFRVDATFSDAQLEAAFSAPADRAPIDTLQSIRTAPLNLDTNEWGVAVINAQANIPGGLPGQSAVFLLVGDAEVENAVAEEDAFQPADPISVQTIMDSNLRQQPNLEAEVVDEIPEDSEILVDAISEDGDWLRAAYNDLGGWVSREVVDEDADLSDLPTYTAMSFTPMQAFYFRTSIGSECSAAPSAVIVQGPQNLTIDINANGADVRLGSTLLFRTLPLDESQDLPENAGSMFQLIVLDGEAILNPDSDNPIIVPAGYTTIACLSKPQNLGTDGISNDSIVLADCGFTEPRPVTDEEWAEFSSLNQIDLNYPIEVEETSEACVPSDEWSNTYTIQPGDALSVIADRFNTTAGAIAAANCIENPDIVSVGQVLRVPGTPEPTATEVPTAVPTQAPQQQQQQPPPEQPTAAPTETISIPVNTPTDTPVTPDVTPPTPTNTPEEEIPPPSTENPEPEETESPNS